jgi:hypothetical protein
VVDFPETLRQSLTSIHVNSTLEPNGLSRDDGKRRDGMTLVPWIKGQPLVWNVTVADTLANSYAIQNQRHFFLRGFPCHSTWKRCKHSGHFSRFRIIIGKCKFHKNVEFIRRLNHLLKSQLILKKNLSLPIRDTEILLFLGRGRQ